MDWTTGMDKLWWQSVHVSMQVQNCRHPENVLIPLQVLILSLIGGVSMVGVAVKVSLSVSDLVSSYRQRNFLKWIQVLQSGSESAVS